MNEHIASIISRLDSRFKEYQSLCFICTAIEVQEEALRDIEMLQMQCSELKQLMINNEDEEAANAMLCCEEILRMFFHEITMYLELKSDKADAAWEHLVRAQSAGRDSMCAHSIGENLGSWVERLHVLEDVLFPQQMFFSIGARAKKTICSICSEIYGECNHVVGRPYMGQICSREIVDATLEEVSVVSNPANKHARAMRYTEHGITREVLSKRVIGRDEVRDKD